MKVCLHFVQTNIFCKAWFLDILHKLLHLGHLIVVKAHVISLAHLLNLLSLSKSKSLDMFKVSEVFVTLYTIEIVNSSLSLMFSMFLPHFVQIQLPSIYSIKELQQPDIIADIWDIFKILKK